MRPIFNIELLLNPLNKMVYVYKIDQIDYSKTIIDIREVIEKIMSKIYVKKQNKKLERDNK